MMKFTQIAQRFSLFIAGISIAFFAIAPAATAHADTITFNATRNCDNNAVVYCGAMTAAELQQKYGNAGVADVYTYFNISSADVSSLGTNAVAGQVTKTGDVIVNGATVATDAQTAGLQDMAGSKQVTSGNTTFYTRAPSVSFQDDKLDAFVVMNNGKFVFAILASCGNPVSAQAKAVPAPTSVPTTPAPTAPAPTTPAPTTTIPTASTPTNSSNLPNTGSGSVIGVFLGTVIAAAAAHTLIRRRLATVRV